MTTSDLARSLKMGERVTPPSAAAAFGGSENSLPKVVTLLNGHMVGIRTMSLGDGDLLREMFSRLSRESIYRRFHIPYLRVPKWAVDLFTGVAGARGEGLVAMAGDQIVGHAMYARSEDGRSADLGIVVEDEWQRRGIGKLLLSRLAAEAERHGIETFTGVGLGENRPMIRLISTVFAGVQSRIRGEQYQMCVPLRSLSRRCW